MLEAAVPAAGYAALIIITLKINIFKLCWHHASGMNIYPSNPASVLKKA